MAACPNKSSQEWKDLVNHLGSETEAMNAFIQNNNEIPTIDKLGSIAGQYDSNAVQGSLARANTIKALDEANSRFETRTFRNEELPKGYFRDEGNTTDLYYDKKENRIIRNRVTHEQSKRFRKSQVLNKTDEKTKRNWDYSAKAGTMMHQAMEDLLLGKPVDSTKVPHVAKLRKRAEAIKKMADETQKKIDPSRNYTIRVEQKIVDPDSDTGGSIDVLVIYSDNSADTYDHKFTVIGKNKKHLAFPWSKTKFQSWDSQASKYKRMLKAYGIDTVRRSLVIPYDVTYKTDNMGNYVGVKEINIEGAQLSPVPLANQMTDDKHVNNLLEKLLAMREDLMGQNTWSDEMKASRLQRLNTEIQKLQLTSDVSGLVNEIVATSQDIQSKLENGAMETKDALEGINLMRAYNAMYPDIKSAIPAEQVDDAKKVLAETSDTLNELEGIIENRVSDLAEENDVDGIHEAQAKLGMFEKLFRGLSQINHPVFQTFYRLVRKANNDTLRKVNGLRSEIQKAMDDLQTYTGKTGVEMYEELLEFRNGKWTGNLASQYSLDFYQKKKKALEGKNIKWLSQNLAFDAKKFEEAKKKKFENLEKAYPRKEDAELLKKMKKDWVDKHDPRSSDIAFLNDRNFFLRGTEANYSDKYKKILATPALKNFYDLFTKTTGRFKDVFPQDQASKIKSNFVPNIKNSMLEQLADTGLASVTGLAESTLRSFEVREGDDTMGMIDPNTGEVRKQIPIMYMEDDKSNKSMDLGRGLLLFADSAYNYEHMARIEHDIYALREVLSQQSEITTDVQGDPIRNKITGELSKTMTGSRDNLGHFEKQMNYQVYGQSLQGRGLGTVEMFGKTISLDKVLKGMMSHLSLKALAFNPISIVANSTGAYINSYFTGLKGMAYNRADWAVGSKLATSKDEKAWNMMHFFDFESHNSTKFKADRLSSSALTKYINKENAFLGQRWGEQLSDGAAVMAMFQSHTLDDGYIRKRKEGEKSLYDIAELKEGELVIEGLTDEGYNRFRAKIQTVSASIKGTASQEDTPMVRSNIMGQVLTHFRSWMPRMVDERFGELRYNQTLEQHEIGRYKAFFGTFAKENMIPLMGALAKEVMSINHNTTDPRIVQRLNSKYADFITKNPESKLSREEFVDMYYGQIRAMSAELKAYLAFFSLLFLPMIDDEPDENKGLKKYAYKMINKCYDEIAFFMSPASALSIIKSPFPLFGQIMSLQSLLTDMIEAPIDLAMDGETDTDVTGKIAKQIPFSSQVVSIMEALKD